jgi:GxxExxY protein
MKIPCGLCVRSERCARKVGERKKPMKENDIAKIVLDVCFSIHKKLGPGLFESAYESGLAFELGKRGLSIDRQVPIPLIWEGMMVHDSFKADMIIEKKVLIELKSVEKLIPVHKKQVLTYLRLTEIKLGLLINFGEELLKDGIERLVNGLDE